MAQFFIQHGLFKILTTASVVLLQIGVSAVATPISLATPQNGGTHFVIGGEDFVPVGVNYLAQHLGAPYQTFDMFDAKTYDADTINKNLGEIAANGFNVVRLWLKGFDPDNGFSSGADQVGDAYADDVLKTLQQAQSHGLHVILTGAFKQSMWLPKNYLPTGPMPQPDVVNGINRLIMIPKMAEATGQFYHDLLVKIAKKDPSVLDTIFYFDLYNELYFDLHQPPFSKTSGYYEFSGHSYDLSNGASRQALMDSASETWLHTVGSRVKAVDPYILVTASSFYLAASGRKGFDGGLNAEAGITPSPYPVHPTAMIKGGMDILDFHTYPSPDRPGLSGFHSRAPHIMMSEGIFATARNPLPLIAGEFGLANSQLFSPTAVLSELSKTKAALCDYHFSGYVVWSWMPGIINALPANQPLLKLVAPRFNAKFCGQLNQHR